MTVVQVVSVTLSCSLCMECAFRASRPETWQHGLNGRTADFSYLVLIGALHLKFRSKGEIWHGQQIRRNGEVSSPNAPIQ